MKKPPSLHLACMYFSISLQASLALVVHRPQHFGLYVLGFFASYLGFAMAFHELKGWWKA